MTDPEDKTHVLFVDDEPLVLQGLQRMLRPMRNEWEMTFLPSGERALEFLGASPCQVVVSDMLMPGMNGAVFLSRVKELYPHTVRLILSGHADKNLIMQCVGTAHQFLAKPCEPEALRTAIARASAFDSSVKSTRIKQLIGKMDCLPSVPAILNEIVERLQDEECRLEDVGELIEKDIAMTAKLLKLVNSAFFGLRRQISSPTDAISYLGLEIIKALVLSLEAFSTYEGRKTGPISVETLWEHSLEVASLAKRIVADSGADRRSSDESFSGGILHDIGKLVLAANVPDEYTHVHRRAREEQIPLWMAEDRDFGANHADIGGYLLSIWGLPVPVIDAIAMHHSPERHGDNSLTPALAVHIADALCHEKTAGWKAPLNMDQVRLAGLETRLEDWRNL